MNSTEIEEAKKRLVEFFAAMKSWGDRYEEEDSDEIAEESAATLKEIHKKFCTTWEAPSRVRNFAFRSFYDPAAEIILRVEEFPDKLVIYTEQTTDFKCKCVYTLLKQDGEWRIVDNRQRIRTDGTLSHWTL